MKKNFFLINKSDSRVKIINQRKFFCTNFPEGKEFSIRSKINYSQINLQKELEKLNKEIDLDLILNKLNYFTDFNGYLIFCDFIGSIYESDKKKQMFGMFFFNIKNYINDLSSYDIAFFKLNSIYDIDTFIFISKFFFEDNNKVFYNNINTNVFLHNLSFVNIDKNSPINYFKFKNLNEFIEHLEKLKIKK